MEVRHALAAPLHSALEAPGRSHLARPVCLASPFLSLPKLAPVSLVTRKVMLKHGLSQLAFREGWLEMAPRATQPLTVATVLRPPQVSHQLPQALTSRALTVVTPQVHLPQALIPRVVTPQVPHHLLQALLSRALTTHAIPQLLRLPLPSPAPR